MSDHEGYQYRDKGIEIDLGSQTVAVASEVIKVIGCEEITLFFTVASIGTNVVCRMQHSTEETNWVHADPDGIDETWTANGTYAIRYDGCASTGYVRGLWVSTSTGTPTISIKARLGGKK